MTIEKPSGHVGSQNRQPQDMSQNKQRHSQPDIGSHLFQQNQNKKQNPSVDQYTLNTFAAKLTAAQATEEISLGTKPRDISSSEDEIADSVTLPAAPLTPFQKPDTPFGLLQQSAPVSQHIEAVVRKVVDHVQSAERFTLAASRGTQVIVPIAIPSLGLEKLNIMLNPEGFSVVVSTLKATDSAVIAAAIQDLTAHLTQKYPNRTIRVSEAKEDPQNETDERVTFDPLRQAVGRRST